MMQMPRMWLTDANWKLYYKLQWVRVTTSSLMWSWGSRGKWDGNGLLFIFHIFFESSSVTSDSLRPQGLYSPWNSPGQNTGVGSLFLRQVPSPIEVRSEVAQSCPTLCDSMDCGLPGSSVHGIFQARVLEWFAISFSWGSSRPRDWIRVSCFAGRRFTIWATRGAHIPYGAK